MHEFAPFGALVRLRIANVAVAKEHIVKVGDAHRVKCFRNTCLKQIHAMLLVCHLSRGNEHLAVGRLDQGAITHVEEE